MSFEKIPKEKWLKLSQEQRDYHTLEFNMSVEKRQKWTIISTRIIAIFFIFGLIYMGYSQIIQAQIYEDRLREYGTYGYCAMCGELNFKRCECEYVQTMDYGNIVKVTNFTELSQELADYNNRQCEPYKDYKERKAAEINDFSFFEK
jgi:hypothetical protein